MTAEGMCDSGDVRMGPMLPEGQRIFVSLLRAQPLLGLTPTGHHFSLK